MLIKFKLILIVALILASLGFSTYGVALAAPHLDIGAALGVPRVSETTETPEVTETPQPSETAEPTEKPELSETPEPSQTAEPTEKPDVSETPDPKEPQNPDQGNQGNGDHQGQDQTGSGGTHDGMGDGGDSLPAWMLAGWRF